MFFCIYSVLNIKKSFNKIKAGELLTTFNSFDAIRQARLLGYAQALRNLGSKE